jgi:molybdenum cofactor synthesis domain-containing protein
MSRALVVTVSTRAAAGVYADTSGPVLVEGLKGLGLEVHGPVVVADGDFLALALAEGVAAYDLVVTSGGTGFSPTDDTPEVTRALLDREAPGLAEALRTYGVSQGVPTAVLSRGVAGLAGRTLIVNLAGSIGAAKDGLAVLGPLLPHLLDQVAGGDHPGGPAGSDRSELAR